ncbi:AmmeMemoRadiSam system protein B [Patescibacteria group bacterium]
MKKNTPSHPKLYKLSLVGIGTLLLLGLIVSFDMQRNTTTNGSPKDTHNVESGLLISQGIRNFSFRGREAKNYLGIVVPHHLIASDYIAKGFQAVNLPPKTIVLLGPNHKDSGNTAVITSMYAWNTEYGAMNPDVEVINELQGIEFVGVDEEAVSQEHSISAIMPFLSYYFPDSYVVPMMLDETLEKDQFEVLSRALSKEDFLIVVSTDFSHYLKHPEALENDKKTLDYIVKRDYQKILGLDNDYLDSSSSLVLFLMIMDALEAGKMDIITHLTSSDIFGDYYLDSITSYYVIGFRK